MDKFDYSNTGDELFSFETIEDDVPVTCLGIEFKNDKERKAYFLKLLAEKLKDPEFRKVEGFPIGKDEDILALSDPPYYCACPNPWLNDFIAEWEAQKPKKPADWVYKREPFASDVSEGKNDPIYNVHSYHTKVPPKAIMRYILHYTDPGDIIYDGFAGSGMTGIAAYRCGMPEYTNDIIKSTNYSLNNDISKLNVGMRKAILNDLSPAAFFISRNFNSCKNKDLENKTVQEAIADVKAKWGWMFETTNEHGEKGEINYTIWSEVFTCPTCGEELIYFNQAVNREDGTVLKQFPCPNCSTMINKKTAKKVMEVSYDSLLKKTVTTAKLVPVLINFTIGKSRFEKCPDEYDIQKLMKIQNLEIPYRIPIELLPDGYNTEQPKKSNGYEYVHQFYTKRNLIVLSAMWEQLPPLSRFSLTNSLSRNLTRLNRFVVNSHNPHGRINGPLTGTLYVPSEQVEQSAFSLFTEKLLKEGWSTHGNVSSISSSTKIQIRDNSIDYIFTDPPFGSNINYSEMSFIWESWLKLKTNTKEEAIENEVQGKGINEYRNLTYLCFKEMYRILKPGHWMTVEFSNSENSVWNAIQNSLTDSGFIIANVSILDKKHGGVRAMSIQTCMKEDLVISAYKPDESFESQITSSDGVNGVWNFVRKHLEYLPVVKESGKEHISYSTVSERDPRILYDRLVSYYVGHNILLPISSPDFLAELDKHFVERDGLYYLPEQVVQYDKLKAQNKIGDEDTTGSLFVHDESSAIAWIREQLKKKTLTTGELTPLFMQELNSWDKNEKRLELAELLEENFLRYDGIGSVPSPIHGYLSTNYKDLRNLDKDNPSLMAKAKGRWYVPDPNKQADLEKLREKGLLREFNGYLQTKGKLKEFRLEAVRAGFKKAWSEKEYKLIIDFAKRIPESVIEEDTKLLMWYNGALTRSEQ